MFQEFAEGPNGTMVDLSKPSVRGLAYLLRDASQWPQGFEFLYHDCRKCAMGLAGRVWGFETNHNNAASNTAQALGITENLANSLFVTRATHGLDCTREAIAADLEAL